MKLHTKLSLWQKIILIFITGILFSFILEASIFNLDVIQNGTNSVKVTKEDSSIALLETYGFQTYTISFSKPVYAKKLFLKFKSTNNSFEYIVYGNVLSNYGSIQDLSQIKDTYYPQLNKSCINLNKHIKKLSIQVPKAAKASFDSLTLDTSFKLNPYRIFFIFVCFFLLFFLIFCKEVFEKNLSVGFGSIGIIIGCTMILLIGTKTPGWDEQIHFNSSYLEVLGSYTSSTALMRDSTVPDFNNYEERNEVSAYLNGLSTDSPSISIDKFVSYNHRAYLGQSAFLLIGKLLHLPADWFYMFGKLGNLLIYILLLGISIRIAKVGKAYILAVGLLPTSLFLSSTYTYDSFITGFIILGFVLWLNEMLTPKEQVVWWKMLITILCFALGSFSKAIYIPLLLLLLLLPKEKFEDKKQMFIFKIGIIITFIVVLSTFLLPALQTSVNATATGTGSSGGLGSDDRGGATDIASQMSVIFNHPLQYTKLLLSSIYSTFGNYIFRDASIFFAHAGYIPMPLSFIPVILLSMVAFVRPKNEKSFTLSKFQRSYLGFLIFGIVCLIWTSMYLAFTPVGEFIINGVQGRYYIPLLVPFYVLLRSEKIHWNISEPCFHRFICGVLVFLNLFGIYSNLLINCI